LPERQVFNDVVVTCTSREDDMKQAIPIKGRKLTIEELEQRIAPDSVVAAGNSGSGSSGNGNGNAVSNGNSPQPVGH
jgi:hypothetical protein